MDLNITSAAQQQSFNPWDIPDSFTLYQMAPEDIRHFLHPHWHNQKAPHPVWFYAFGLWYFFVAIIGTFGNYCVIHIFGNTPALRTPSNMLVMNLAVTDMLMLITMLPECIHNFFNGGPWRFGEYMCYAHAFCGGLTGGCQIMTLTMISWDRYNMIANGLSENALSFRKAMILIAIAWLIALGWAVIPLFGIGNFTLDSMLGSCSYDGLTTTITNKYYILSYAVCMYFCPLLFITGCYLLIVRTVFKRHDELHQKAKMMNVSSIRSGIDQYEMTAEIRTAKVAILNITMWLVSWTPYVMFCLIGTWGNQSGITPLPSMLQSLLSKTSCAYNPVIYCFTHPIFRENLKKLHPWMCIVIDAKPKIRDNQSVSSIKTGSSDGTEP